MNTLKLIGAILYLVIVISIISTIAVHYKLPILSLFDSINHASVLITFLGYIVLTICTLIALVIIVLPAHLMTNFKFD